MNMVRNLIILLILMANTAFAWFDSNIGPVRSVYISKIGNFTSIGESYTNALDWGTNGYPVQIDINVNDPTQQAYIEITGLTLQYTSITNAALFSDWTTIKTVTAIQGVNLNKNGAHFGFKWSPPIPGAYLLRLAVTVQGGNTSGDLFEDDVNAYGGPATWENWEVVGIIRNNKIPGIK